jgi:hypothetical protein
MIQLFYTFLLFSHIKQNNIFAIQAGPVAEITFERGETSLTEMKISI